MERLHIRKSNFFSVIIYYLDRKHPTILYRPIRHFVINQNYIHAHPEWTISRLPFNSKIYNIYYKNTTVYVKKSTVIRGGKRIKYYQIINNFRCYNPVSTKYHAFKNGVQTVHRMWEEWCEEFLTGSNGCFHFVNNSNI